MKHSKILTAALAGALTVSLGFMAIAQDNPHEAREALMKQNGGIMRSAGGLTGPEAIAAAEALVANFTTLPTLFPEGSGEGTDALPAIWENLDAFNGIFAKAKGGAEAALAAATAGDATAYADALKVIGGTCGECHATYRAQ